MVKVTFSQLKKNPKILTNNSVYEYLGEDLLRRIIQHIKDYSPITIKGLSEQHIGGNEGQVHLCIRNLGTAKHILEKLRKYGLINKKGIFYKVK